MTLPTSRSQLILLMDLHKQETSLSFSIENILRDDFPKLPRSRPSVVSLPTFHPDPSFGRNLPSTPLLRCYAVRYSPVFLRFLPNIHKMSTRLHHVDRVKELILSQQPQRIDEDHLSCDEEKGEERKQEHGEWIFLRCDFVKYKHNVDIWCTEQMCTELKSKW